METPTSPLRLCIYCRALERTDQPCPTQENRNSPQFGNAVSAATKQDPASGLTEEDAQLIHALQQEPSSLCNRCSAWNVVDIFTKSQPMDILQRQASYNPGQYSKSMDPYRPRLGELSNLLLTPSCPFCRLLYCIVSRDLESDGDVPVLLEPFRSYIQHNGWESLPERWRSEGAVFLGVATGSDPLAPIGDPFRKGDHDIRFAMMTGPAIAMETQCTPPDRRTMNARPLNSILDLSILKKLLQNCEQKHGDYCRTKKPPELLTARMIDVERREVVPCPPDCDYLALSYVWGGVQPVAGALENRHLPQTIEDAITVTKALGRRYLWVDALCIDQSPNPTPAQRQEKTQQLNMMATIYGCATLTIIALTGKNANAGLAGISVRRPVQIRETIDGHNFFTIPQELNVERSITNWSTRAWTLQEEILSMRILQFTESQVDFSCLMGSVWEGTDPDTGYKSDYPQHSAQPLVRMVTRLEMPPEEEVAITQADLEGKMRLYGGILRVYTSRRMTNEGDSLNAFLGLLAGFKRRLFPLGFYHGLPLQSHPATLGWVDDRVEHPHRRLDFPSWSWAGWEGTALIPPDILDTYDDPENRDREPDLEVRILKCEGNELTVEGWVVNLDIRTDPFSELFVPDQEDSIATVKEGRWEHHNTFATGHYDCLVVQRQERNPTRNPQRQRVFLIVLELVGERAQRQTLITLNFFAGHDFMQTKPYKRIVRLV